MRCTDLFKSMSPALAAEIPAFLENSERDGYKALIANLAQRSHLRPQFVQRKPRPERNRWLADALGKRSSEDLAGHVLQLWLVGARSAMLCKFLDSLEIKHDERGMIEDLPESPGREKIQAAVDGILAEYPQEEVAIYLQAFQMMDEKPWPELGEILDSDSRLALNVPA